MLRDPENHAKCATLILTLCSYTCLLSVSILSRVHSITTPYLLLSTYRRVFGALLVVSDGKPHKLLNPRIRGLQE